MLWLALAMAMAALLVAVPGTAHAQPNTEQVTAESLFREGMALMKAGAHSEACERLAASVRLQKAMGAQFQLAACWEKVGKLVSAWSLYVEIARAAKDAAKDADEADAAVMQKREETTRKAAAALQRRLPKLIIEVPAEVAALEGLKVLRAGSDVARSLWGLPVPVDPGSQQVTVTAPGHEDWTSERKTAEGEVVTITVELLRPLAP